MIAYTLSSREYARELAKLQSLDKGGKKSFITSDKVEELGWTITETTTNVTTASPSNATTATTTDATAGGKCTVATLANMMVIATIEYTVHAWEILAGDN